VALAVRAELVVKAAAEETAKEKIKMPSVARQDCVEHCERLARTADLVRQEADRILMKDQQTTQRS